MFLDEIVAQTRHLVAERKGQKPLTELEREVSRCQEVRDFAAALQKPGLALIAEIKRASPSKGWLNPDLDAAALAQLYAQGGAAAISVLTEPAFFRGSLDDLAGAREAVELPVLRKDFILDPYQVYEARGCAADAVLLIAAILSPSELAALIELAHSLGMSALVEVHHHEELERALACGARIIGINNRNLADFSVDLETTPKLRPLIPPDIPVVSESGIHSQADVLLLRRAGVNAILVGEMLVTSADPAAKIRELLAEVASPR